MRKEKESEKERSLKEESPTTSPRCVSTCVEDLRPSALETEVGPRGVKPGGQRRTCAFRKSSIKITNFHVSSNSFKKHKLVTF